MNAVTARTLAGVTVLASAAVLAGPAPAAITGGLLLGLVLPGLALTAALFRGRPLTGVERSVLASALSLAVLVVSGLVLSATGITLDRITWTSATAVVTLLALVVPGIPLPRPDRGKPARIADMEIAQLAAAAKLATVGVGEQRVRLSPEIIRSLRPAEKPPLARIARQLLPMVLVAAVLGGAGWLSFTSSHRSYDVTVTALSAAPPGDVDAAGRRTVRITASGLLAADGPYLVTVVEPDGTQLDRRSVPATTGASWSANVSVGRERTTVNLYRARELSAYRTLFIAAAE